MVCYKAVGQQWNKPTNPVQPIVTTPKDQLSQQPPEIPTPPTTAKQQPSESQTANFSSQDIRYQDAAVPAKPNNIRSNHGKLHDNNAPRQQIVQHPVKNTTPVHDNIHVSRPSFKHRAPIPQHNNQNSQRHTHPSSARMTGPNHTNQPFTPYRTNQPTRLPCEHDPNGPLPIDNMHYHPSRAPPLGPQHSAHPISGQRAPGPPMSGQRAPGPPMSGQRPPRPPMMMTGIDPYTNKAYGCSDAGYTGCGAIAQPPPRHPVNMPNRHSGNVPIRHPGNNEGGIRHPAPVRHHQQNHSAPILNHPDVKKTYKKGGSGRGRVPSQGALIKISNSGVEVQYKSDRKVVTASFKEPGEEDVKAAMRKDSEENSKNMGLWDNETCDVKGVVKKPGIENTHVFIDSDASSDDVVDEVPQEGQDIASKSQEVNEGDLTNDQLTDTSQSEQIEDSVSSEISNKPGTAVSTSPSITGVTGSDVLTSEELTSPVTLDSEENPLVANEDLESELPSLPPTLTPILPDEQPCSPPLTLPAEQTLPTPPPLIPIIPDSTVMPDLTTQQVNVPSSHSQQSETLSSSFNSELQQISANLYNFNFGLESASDEDEDDEDMMFPELTPACEVRPTVTTLETSQPDTTEPHHFTGSTQHPTGPTQLPKLGTILKPVSSLCEKEGLSPPVLVIHHRPSDAISPWRCELTVEDKFSSVGEGCSQKGALLLAAAAIKPSILSKRPCRQFKQQTDFLAHILHHCCKLKRLFPPIYHIVHKAADKVNITAAVNGDTLYSEKGLPTSDLALSQCFEQCCMDFQAPVPGLPSWRKEYLDYREELMLCHPDATFSTNRVEGNWWAEVFVDGTLYIVHCT